MSRNFTTSTRRKRTPAKDSKRRSAARPVSFVPGEAVRILRIGTRGSVLAKWQAESVRKKLFAATGREAEIVVIKTSGDKMQQAPLTQIGGKGIFIKELEEALIEEAIDLAVHSVKDVPTDIPSRLMFPAVCRRDDVRDCLVGSTLANLRNGARVGTSSLRRQAQLRHLRPDLDLRDLRGNVDTRLRKVERGELGLESCVWSVDGSQYVKQRAAALLDQAAQLGEHMARILIEAGAQSILEEVSRQRG